MLAFTSCFSFITVNSLTHTYNRLLLSSMRKRVRWHLTVIQSPVRVSKMKASKRLMRWNHIFFPPEMEPMTLGWSSSTTERGKSSTWLTVCCPGSQPGPSVCLSVQRWLMGSLPAQTGEGPCVPRPATAPAEHTLYEGQGKLGRPLHRFIALASLYLQGGIKVLKWRMLDLSLTHTSRNLFGRVTTIFLYKIHTHTPAT